MAQVVKNLPAHAGDTGDVGSIPRSGRCPGMEKEMATHTPVFLPGKSHGQRSLAGHKESGMTEQLSTHATYMLGYQ